MAKVVHLNYFHLNCFPHIGRVIFDHVPVVNETQVNSQRSAQHNVLTSTIHKTSQVYYIYIVFNYVQAVLEC